MAKFDLDIFITHDDIRNENWPNSQISDLICIQENYLWSIVSHQRDRRKPL